MHRRALNVQAGFVFLALIVAGCDRASVVKPPLNNTVSIPTIPNKTLDETGKSIDAGGGDSTSKAHPPIKVYAANELQQVVAALANDDPDERLTRVWVRNDQAQAVDIVLSNSLVTDEGLAKLAGIARLRHLNLDDCREITSAGMAHLTALKDLRKLSLNRTAVDDAGLAHFPALSGLTELSLVGNVGVSDAGASHLARCLELRVLRLKDTRLGDKGLGELKGLPNLREIWLEGTRVTEKGIAELEFGRSGIQIVHPLRRGKRTLAP